MANVRILQELPFLKHAFSYHLPKSTLDSRSTTFCTEHESKLSERMNFDVLKPTLFHQSISETPNWQIVK